ncbi:alpha-galactosidase [Cutibacterium acnes JCM 18918]|nr:alpha-galactosidase [Cutibacterium acnes JCM 18918]
MTPGLWIEPLAVGLRSPLVNDLPPELSCAAQGFRSSNRIGCV